MGAGGRRILSSRNGRDPDLDRRGIAEATLSGREAVDRCDSGQARVRGQHDPSQTATRRGRGPTERTSPETAGREIPGPAGLYLEAINRATEGRVVVH